MEAIVSIKVKLQDFHCIEDMEIFDLCESLFVDGFPKQAHQVKVLWLENQALKKLINELDQQVKTKASNSAVTHPIKIVAN